MKYFVRKTWKDKESQIGEFTNLDEAVKNCKVGYTIFNRNGKDLITSTSIKDHHSDASHKDYQAMWEKLKEEYIMKYKDIQLNREYHQNTFVSLLIKEQFYTDLLNRMSEIEEE